MLPPKVDATLTVAHAKAIQEHRNAHHKATQDHRLAQERCEALEEECKELRAADARREKALHVPLAQQTTDACRGKLVRACGDIIVDTDLLVRTIASTAHALRHFAQHR